MIHALREKRILLIENDGILRDVLTTILKAETCMVRASDMFHFTEILDVWKPAVALIDIPYKKASKEARAIVKIIKQRNKYTHIVFSSTDPRVAAMTKQLGGNDFLEEPFDIDVFLKKVTTIFAM